MTLYQKQLFLDSEGDNWYERNKGVDASNLNLLPSHSIVYKSISSLPVAHNRDVKAVEVGCGQGILSAALKNDFGWNMYGIDPSESAICSASKLGVVASVGTADQLDFPDASFDVFIFGFCLYLCDTDLLFRISSEAHRILKPSSWLVIHDFWSKYPVYIPYKHVPGVISRKADYSKMFTWHEDYTVYSHLLEDHSSSHFSDNPYEWVSATVLRKSPFQSL